MEMYKNAAEKSLKIVDSQSMRELVKDKDDILIIFDNLICDIAAIDNPEIDIEEFKALVCYFDLDEAPELESVNAKIIDTFFSFGQEWADGICASNSVSRE